MEYLAGIGLPKPAVWLSSWPTFGVVVPGAACRYSTYSSTGASRSRRPSSASRHAAVAVTILDMPYAMNATTMTNGSETTEAMEVTMVRVLKVPWVDSPSSDLNIQKKLLLT